MNVTDHQRIADAAAKEFVDRGQLIEAGWAALRATWLSPNAPPNQVKAMRYAYMAGAQHLFASIMGVLDAGEEPTAGDLHRMELISRELTAFYDEVQRDMPVRGQA